MEAYSIKVGRTNEGVSFVFEPPLTPRSKQLVGKAFDTTLDRFKEIVVDGEILATKANFGPLRPGVIEFGLGAAAQVLAGVSVETTIDYSTHFVPSAETLVSSQQDN